MTIYAKSSYHLLLLHKSGEVLRHKTGFFSLPDAREDGKEAVDIGDADRYAILRVIENSQDFENLE